jgi:hypothetical protein
VPEFILILYRWMVAIPQRAERVLQAGWSAWKQRAASPDGSDSFRRLAPAWIDPQQSRISWMTYRLGHGVSGIPGELVPDCASRISGRRAHPDLSGPVHFNHFLSCSERAPRAIAARLGAHGRLTNLSISRIGRWFLMRFDIQNA